jgi:hypothetical protein
VRRFLAPRWLGLHAAMVVIVAGFLALGWWQLRRAAEGNALSWGYTFEWPLFAGFVVVFWLRAMRDELRESRGQGTPHAGAVPPAALPARLRPGGGADSAAGAADDDEELAAYNAYLARLNAEASRQAERLARRGARRQAAGWASLGAGSQRQRGRRGPEPGPGVPPHMEV